MSGARGTLVLAVMATALPGVADAQAPCARMRPPPGVYTWCEVEQLPVAPDSLPLAVPDGFAAHGVAGRVTAVVTVDSTGRVDPASLRVEEPNDARLAQRLRAALPTWRLAPARHAGRAVPVMVPLDVHFTTPHARGYREARVARVRGMLDGLYLRTIWRPASASPVSP